MPDVFSPEKRSRIMAKVKGKNTKPEITVRSMVHRMGFRFRLHVKDSPGKPDIVLPRHRKVIFVHGCFWHQHKGCKRSKRPAGNTEFWNAKLDANRKRDERDKRKLKKLGWKVLVLWECQVKDAAKLERKLTRFLCE